MLNRNDKPFGPKLAFCVSLPLLLLAAACGPSTPPDNRAADVSTLRDLDAVMVVEEGKPVGVITRYDLLGFLSDGALRK